MIVRGERVFILPHAQDGMDGERPPIRPDDLARVLERPDSDDGTCARSHRRGRTILVYHDDLEDEIEIRSVSATRRSLDS